jgi:uncharacterized protein (TIGR00251 family)
MEAGTPSLDKLLVETKRGVELTVYVKPGAREEKLAYEDGDLVFYTSEPPVKGRANASLIRFLSRSLKIPSSRIDIVAGLRDRSKRILFRDARLEDLAEKLSSILESSE